MENVFIEFYRLESIMESVEKEYAKNYIVIRLVTIIEQFFRNITETLLKKTQKDYSGEITLKAAIIDDIIEVASYETSKITKELIISSSYQFQNTNDIKSRMDKFGVNIFNNDIREIEYDKLFKLRHEIVHTLNQPPLDIKRHYKLIEKLMKCVLDTTKEQDGSFYILKGIALQELGEHHRALDCFNKAIDIKPDHGSRQHYKIAPLQKLGEHDRALECFDIALELKPDHVGYFNKGTYLQELGEYRKAIECFDKALELYPRYDFAYLSKAESLQELGKHRKAIECFDKALDLYLKDPTIYVGKGKSLQKIGKHRKAIECFDKATHPNSTRSFFAGDFSTWYYKGLSLLTLKKYCEAAECFIKELEWNYKNTKQINAMLEKCRDYA